MKTFVKIIVILFLFNSGLFSQTKKLDSLIKAFNSTTVDTAKIIFALEINEIAQINKPIDTFGLKFLRLAYTDTKHLGNTKLRYRLVSKSANTYYRNNMFEECIKYNQEALLIATALKNVHSTTETLILMGHSYGGLRKHNLSEKYLLQALELAKKSKNLKQQARIYNGLGGQYHNIGNYENSMKYFYESLGIYESLKDTGQIVTLFKNLSMAYESIKDLEKGRQLLFKALQLAFVQKDSTTIGDIYGSIGANYQTGLIMDSALVYNNKQVSFYSKQNNNDNLAMAYGNLGIIYKSKKDFINCKKYYQKALAIFKETKSYRLITISNLNIAELYTLTKNYKEALQVYDEVIRETLASSEKDILIAAHQGKYETYLGLSDYKNALSEYILYKTIDDSVRNGKNISKMMRLENKFELGKKEKENEILKVQNKIKQAEVAISREKEKSTKLTLYWSLVVLVIIMILTAVTFRSLRQNKIQNKVIKDQNLMVETKNKDIIDSINYAKRIQEAILPAKELKYKLFPNAFVLFEPKDIVSGDFYWFTEKNNKKIISAIDCTGHGVPGAFMSLIGNTFLHEAVNEKGITNPGLILNELRNNVITSLKQTDVTDSTKDGMDMALLSFDSINNTVEFAGANNPLWLIRKGECIEYKGDKRPIGYFRGKGMPFTNTTIELINGDALYIFTDGFADQFGGEKGKKLKYKQLKDSLLSIQKMTMPEQEQFLIKTFKSWKGDLEQVDDVLIIGIKI